MTPPAAREDNVRLIAFYLTQFHPVPENDQWWGKGFTEWTNVAKAKPLFDGHYQPHLPTDFGFYDLRVRATRHDQIRTAKQYGIDGFCYHYYWFSGTRLLNQPLDDMLADPDSDMPFCLCWANENWTRRWDGAEHQVLIAQQYLPDDDLRFIESLVPYLKDPRYITLDGAPILVVYRPQHLPDPRRTAQVWRDYCRGIGIERIHLCAALTHGNEGYAHFGFDSGVEFPPHNLQTRNYADSIIFHERFAGNYQNYIDIARTYLERTYPSANVFRGVFPAWDNTPRTGNRAVIVGNTSPDNYEHWLDGAIRATRRDFPQQPRLVFINAWNEWAEGCHLEPDCRYQREYLEATLRASLGLSSVRAYVTPQLPGSADGSRKTLASDLHRVFSYHFWQLFGRMANALKRYPRLRRIVRRLLRK